jgi:hypothetical protein
LVSRKDYQDDPGRGGEGERGRMGEGENWRMGENLMSFYGNPMGSLNGEQFTCWRLLASIWENQVSGH